MANGNVVFLEARSERFESLETVGARDIAVRSPEAARGRDGDLPGLAVVATDHHLDGNAAHRGEIDRPAPYGLEIADSDPEVAIEVEQRDDTRGSDRDRPQRLGMQIVVTVREVATPGESEQREAIAGSISL